MLHSNHPLCEVVDRDQRNLLFVLLPLLLLSCSLVTHGQQKFQPGNNLKADVKVRLVIANFNAAPRDTLFILKIPASISAVLVNNEGGNFLFSNSPIELPVIISSKIGTVSPVTTVEYSISSSGKVQLNALDAAGKKTEILWNRRHVNINHCSKFRPIILNAVLLPAE